MKLVELKCKNCGAKLSIPKDSKIVTCDFCKTTFQIDDEIKHIKYDNMMQSGYEFEKGRIRAQEERKEKQIEEFVNFCEQQTISNKRKKTALILCCIGFVGINGLHEFYVGNSKKGWIKLFTLNYFIFGLFYDLLKISIGKFQDKYGKYLKN